MGVIDGFFELVFVVGDDCELVVDLFGMVYDVG